MSMHAMTIDGHLETICELVWSIDTEYEHKRLLGVVSTTYVL